MVNKNRKGLVAGKLFFVSSVLKCESELGRGFNGTKEFCYRYSGSYKNQRKSLLTL